MGFTTKNSTVFFYCVMRVTVTVWVETTVPEVPVATTVTWELVAGGAPVAVPLVPQLDSPAAKAQVDTSSRQSCQEYCVFTRIRLRRKTANPVRPPGHQKASANNVGLSGLCGACLPACCAVALIVSPTFTLWLLPLSVTCFGANAQLTFVGKFEQLNVIDPL
jgi:hypothetical protein